MYVMCLQIFVNNKILSSTIFNDFEYYGSLLHLKI
uniref:Uncharacterized protein n=1 Tax=Triticum urartu TaxID=4572 RepID=A0A8R7R508_TRIUA